ncbi:pyrroloquinoline quinone precursor peptide PqqA [Pseudogulbenkiania subflava]|uniref:pyrroloquinoline quinone precursor peptide PqqA n=1 Tax=Pseudogulbenkiania subflava TaxID=451637 RepID=UPI000A156AC6
MWQPTQATSVRQIPETPRSSWTTPVRLSRSSTRGRSKPQRVSIRRCHPASPQPGESIMRIWTKPQIIEVCLGCEINCYMSAER